MADKYNSMKELYSFEPVKHYKLTTRAKPSSKVLVLSSHGGSIEFFTSEIASQVAGDDFKYFDFAGVMPRGNFENLHVTSKHYDCSLVKKLNASAHYSLAIHGCTGEENDRVTFIGGQDEMGQLLMRKHLEAAGFKVKDAPSHLSGLGNENVVNQNQRGMGIQLEISKAQRQAFTSRPVISILTRKKSSKTFERYCAALRAALSELSAEPLSTLAD